MNRIFAGKGSQRKLRWVGFAAALLLLAPPAMAEKVRVSLPGFASVQAYLFAAIDKGYLAQEGIEVEMVQAGGGIATPALISGDFQFSNSPSSAVSAILKGAPLKVIMISSNRTDWQLWATSPDIKTLADLKGKQIGVVSRGDTGEVSIRYLLNEKKLPSDYVAFTPFGTAAARMAALASGSVPAMLLEPIDVEVMRAAHVLDRAHLVDKMADDFLMPNAGLATSDALMQKNPKLVAGFLRAVLKGQTYGRENRAGTIAMVAKYAKTSEDVVSREYDVVQPSMTVDGTIPPEVQANDVKLRADLVGVAPADVPPASKAYDFSIAQSVSKQLADEKWSPAP